MTKHLLLEAKAEIESLRRQNEILHAKVSTMELFATVLHTDPRYPSQAMAVDVAWNIQRAVEEIEAKERAGSPPAGMNHFCPGESGNGEWSNRSEEVPSRCGYCGEQNEALLRSQENANMEAPNA